MDLRSKIFRGSLVLLLTFNIFNALNLLFQISMARLLSVAEYGILASLFSFIYIFSFFTQSIQLVITRYSAVATKTSSLTYLLRKSLQKAMSYSFVLFLLFLLLVYPLSELFSIEPGLLLLVGIMIILSFLSPINRGIMQGRKQFGSLGGNMVIEGVVKLLLAILLVWIGWSVYGAVLGILLGSLVALTLSFIPIRDIILSPLQERSTQGIYRYSLPVFYSTLMLMIFFSLDILLANLFFDEVSVGAYAIASTIAKIIYIGTVPIGRALFPITAMTQQSASSSRQFIRAILLLGMCCGIGLVILLLFPETLIALFSGKNLSTSASIVFFLGIGTSIFAFSQLLVLYRLSQNSTQRFYLLIFGPFIEILCLYLFSSSLWAFSQGYVIANVLFFILVMLSLTKKT